ncbi:MAG: hypothetical protein H0W86_11725 [Armatimonadetes bacterium]|nr:hypothetical protein [Armatimonadota bacterium]
MKPEMDSRINTPVKRSDVIEGQWEKAITWGIFGLLSLLLGLIIFKYGDGWFQFGKFQGLDLTAISYPFLGLASILILYAIAKAASSRKVTSYTATCPYCGHDTMFVEQPMDDFACEDCHRRVPVMDGNVLDVTGIRCGFCGALNFMSDKTKVLICEECDREIPLLDAKTGEMRHAAKGYARVDDDAVYELMLVGVGKDREALINSLQHMLAMTRNQVKDMLDNLPAPMLKGINRRKAEMLTAQIEANEGRAEYRPMST